MTPHSRTVIAVVASLAIALHLPLAPQATAELPPYVYAQEQRQAPVRLLLQIIRVNQGPAKPRIKGPGQDIPVTVEARILAVQRNRSRQTLRPGQTIRLRYNRAVLPEGFVGPSPVPIPAPGSRVTAWLQPHPQLPFLPAAGGLSFGPDLESVREEPAPASR